MNKLCPYRKAIYKTETISLETTTTQIEVVFSYCSEDACPFFECYSNKNYCKKVKRELDKK